MASQTNHRVRVSPHVSANALIALGAASLSTWPGPAAQAQVRPPLQVPNGSYRASCNNIQVSSDSPDFHIILHADCRKIDGTSVAAVLFLGHCTGDISNNNGALQCPTN